MTVWLDLSSALRAMRGDVLCTLVRANGRCKTHTHTQAPDPYVSRVCE